MENSKEYKVNRYFFLAIIIALAIFLVFSLIQFFTAFLLAIIIYILGKPLSDWLIKRRRWRKSMAALLIIALSFFIILLPVITLVSLLYDKISSVITHPESILSSLKSFDAYMQNRFGLKLISDKNITELQSYATSGLSVILSQGLSFFSTIIMSYFFLYFMMINTGKMEAAIVFYLPFKKDKLLLFGNELVAQTFSNSVGIPLIAVAQGICGYISFLIAGVPEPGFWGIIAGFASVIPVVGTGIVWVPISIYLFATGNNWQGFFVIIWGLLIMGSADNVIRFLLAKRMADVHPIVTVLGVIMGLKYFGVAGLIFGPILISFFILLLKIYYLEYQKPAAAKRTSKPRQLMPSYMQPFLGGNIKKKK
ncbi:AI-2E family transporter [Panacibacter ginsenosidivorans]|uniref:AI-2E family transporter n=1 Tax=Panacibacter ginsenosidivorans TaxID=1813871 RepID=A0A5B8V9X9_9BACT|nr:AI-2E family transporter [Panacibacter ginsenosidivorans]QEC67526.1 AI-2E family transporter [Panacibacter ginsenosidivorans]